MPRRGALFWTATAVVAAGIALYLPAWLAARATAPDGGVDFYSHPIAGWRFLAEAVTELPGAAAGSPEQAGRIAAARFADGSAVPTRVDLLYLPQRWIEIDGGQGTGRLATNATLVWRVTGRLRPGGPLQTVGLIDLASGAVIYDARKH